MMINYEKVLEHFNQYVGKFDLNNQEIMAKVYHSYRVVEVATLLALKLGLSEEDTLILKTIAILHDIGRFTQFVEGGIYNDQLSKMDHAELGVHYLFTEGHIDDFEIPKCYYKIIEKAIANHNRLAIEECLSEEELFFSKLIRDADKIDIFKVLGTDYKDLNFGGLFKGPISKNVWKSFFAHELVDRNDVKITKDISADFFISQIAYAYEMNFEESYEVLKETGNLDLFLSIIHADNYINELNLVKTEVKNFVESKLKGRQL